MSANLISGGTISGNNINVTNLNAANISTGTITAGRFGNNTIDIGTQGVIGSAGAIAGTIGSVSQSTNSAGTLNQYYGGNDGLVKFYGSGNFFSNTVDSGSFSQTLANIASLTFTTGRARSGISGSTQTRGYTILAVPSNTAVFNRDEDVLYVIAAFNSSGSVLFQAFQFSSFPFDAAASLFPIAGRVADGTLPANSTITVRVYAGFKNVGAITQTFNLMVFGLNF